MTSLICALYSVPISAPWRMIKDMEPRTPIGLIVPFIPADPVNLMREMDAIIYLVYLDSEPRDCPQPA